MRWDRTLGRELYFIIIFFEKTSWPTISESAIKPPDTEISQSLCTTRLTTTGLNVYWRSLWRCHGDGTNKRLVVSLLHLADWQPLSFLPRDRAQQPAENSCVTYSEELRARVSAFDYILAFRVLTISREGAEDGRRY